MDTDPNAVKKIKPQGDGLPRLIQIMARLRSPGGCPWDLKQTMKDLKVYLIDEAYEVLDAIDSGDCQLLCEELGDLLFQIIFLAQLAQEEGVFDMDGIIRGIEKKMIRRHPHVFGDSQVSGASDVVDQWETIKVKEGKKPRTSMPSGVPENLPALYEAYRLGLRAGRVGFDWPNREQVLTKVHEELSEVEKEVLNGDLQAATEELGDLLFVLANLARHLGKDPEGLLRKTNAKFVRRFQWLETALRERGSSPQEATLEQMDRLWEEAKAQEQTPSKGSP